MKDVAVILPVYGNDEVPYVRLSFDSILNQTYRDIHLYVGVDGPVGAELEECLKSYERQEGISVLWFPKNRGLAIVLNDLLDICFKEGYEYIARMDADDISMPERIARQRAYLQTHPGIDIVGGAIEEIDGDNRSRGKKIMYPERPQECYRFFARRNPHAHPAVMFRKSFFDKAGCKYRPEYRQNQDTMLWLDGMKSGTQHANLQEVVLKFRFTDSLFKKRRNGWAFAKKQLHDRKMINRALGYGMGAAIFGYMMFFVLVSPTCVKKFAYKVFR
jgi:Glycosyltransferases involved in cell wall biogenesis